MLATSEDRQMFCSRASMFAIYDGGERSHGHVAAYVTWRVAKVLRQPRAHTHTTRMPRRRTNKRHVQHLNCEAGFLQARKELRDRVAQEREEEERRALPFRPKLNSSKTESVLKITSSPEKYAQYVKERRAKLEIKARQILNEKEVCASVCVPTLPHAFTLAPCAHVRQMACHGFVQTRMVERPAFSSTKT